MLDRAAPSILELLRRLDEVFCSQSSDINGAELRHISPCFALLKLVKLLHFEGHIALNVDDLGSS